ncbi:MAG: response regulator [Cyclobacteriaceae bacterium]|nr:response regulator [Cyclobacteriaceae bacterium]
MVAVSTFQTVFLVDDNEVDLFVQKRFIEMKKFADNIVTFSSPSKALEALTNNPAHVPGILFLDLNMPMLNGFEFLERVREKSQDIFNQLRVVVLTSSNSQFDRDRAFSFSNVIRFIPKPLTSQGLDELLSSLNA